MLQARGPRAIVVALAIVSASLVLALSPLSSPAAVHHLAKPAVSAPARKPVRPAGYHPHLGLAPADEYFGRLGMSVLGVRNKVKDLGLDADLHPEHDAAILSNALWVEDSMRAWAQQYPFDRWLPRYAFALEQMYEEIPGDAAHKRAIKQLGYITAYFPQTVYAKVGRYKLAYGIVSPAPSAQPSAVPTELQRLALIDGKVIPTIPPAPTPKPSATPQPPHSTPEPSPAMGAMSPR